MRRFILLLLLASVPARAQSFGSPGRFTEATGPEIYRYVCAGCHMPDGRGATGAATYPSLANNQHLAIRPYVIGTVLHGKRAMPPFERLLTNQQIADIVDTIRQSFGNAYPGAPSPADVQVQRTGGATQGSAP